MNINLNPTILSRKNGSITYPSGNRLTYTRNGNGSIFEYEYEFGKLRFNDLAPEWDFIPVESNFYAKLTDDGRVLDKPQIQFSMPKLKKNELYIMASMHELGHADFFDSLHKKLTSLGQGNYTNILLNSYKFFEEIYGKEEIKKRNERHAWAFALRKRKQLKMLKKVDMKKIKEYYINCLRSYGDEFHD